MANKIIVILGPTASGKSDLAVKIAKKFNGEVISADSRQVYKGMDIGTGKITRKEMQGIPHYLLDVASPKRKFTVAQYRRLALAAVKKILKKNKLPVICGGTAFYIYALLDGIVIPEIAPDWALRKKLERKTPAELFNRLKEMDPQRAKTIESKNKRRLIRAIEIILKTKRPVPSLKKSPLPYPALIIGIKKDNLDAAIEKRFFKWLEKGFLLEVKKLKNPPAGGGLSWKRIEDFGIHYRTAAQYLQGKINEEEFIESSLRELKNYVKRQMTWFTRQSFVPQNLGGLKKDKRIHWVKNYQEAEKLVKEFLEKK